MPVWRTARDFYAGTRAVHANIDAYLPRHPAEEDDEYHDRGRFSELFNGYRRTITGMAGQVFKKPPVLGSDVPDVIKKHADDIDGRGNAIGIFLYRFFIDCLTTGCGGVLVDTNTTRQPGEEPLNSAEEERLGVRPYWVRYDAEDIISWQHERIDGRLMLTQLVLREMKQVPAGVFGIKTTEMYRVYRLAHKVENDDDALRRVVTFEEWEKVDDPSKHDGASVVKTGVTGEIMNVDRIPFVAFMLGAPTSALTAEPPLQDLLDLNLGHFRVSSDRRWLMHLACVPVPVRKGYQPPATAKGKKPVAMRFGPNIMQDLPKDGDFQWAEVTGAAFVPTGEEIKEIEKRMAAVGLAFLASDTRGAETAVAKTIDASAQNATLSSSADLFDDGCEQLVALHALHMKLIEPKLDGTISAGSLSTNREFEKQLLDAGKLSAYSAMQTAGQFTLETLWKLLERGGELPDDFDPKKEKAQLELEADTGGQDLFDDNGDPLPLLDAKDPLLGAPVPVPDGKTLPDTLPTDPPV